MYSLQIMHFCNGSQCSRCKVIFWLTLCFSLLSFIQLLYHFSLLLNNNSSTTVFLIIIRSKNSRNKPRSQNAPKKLEYATRGIPPETITNTGRSLSCERSQPVTSLMVWSFHLTFKKICYSLSCSHCKDIILLSCSYILIGSYRYATSILNSDAHLRGRQ